jgi:hypothetical protein
MRHIAKLPLLTAAAVMTLAQSAAHAQAGEPALAERMRECRQLAAASARTACYDAIQIDGPDPIAVRGQPAAIEPERRGASEFGSNQLRAPASAAWQEPDRIAARVARAVERQPGIYLLTLDDGTEWQFADSAPAAYDPPRAGAAIEISRASLGSYLLRYAGQPAIRARRVR